MMDCKIIQDLLPLYTDGCCSESSAQLVEEHLKTCTNCRDTLLEMKGDLPAAQPPSPEEKNGQALKTGMKKIRRRWLVSLLAVLILMAAAKIGWNQVRGTGLHPTNLNEYRICSAFLRELVQNDYEGAYQYFDINSIRTDWAEWEFDSEKMDALETNGLEMFLNSTAALKEAGLTNYHYLDAYEIDSVCTFYFVVTVGGKEDTLQLIVNDRGIEQVYGGNGYLPAPDALTQMGLWREYLWQDYSGCYYDWTTGSYVYDNAG